MTLILIVDDNETNMKLAADVLTDVGYDVMKAADADRALAALAANLPDLILMDLSMPGMDGLSLTRKLKADERYRAIPIVALTASAMKGDEERAVIAGCEGYITKPIDTRQFVSQLAKYLEKPKPAAADPTSTSGRMSVLVVDDSAQNRKLLTAGLEHEGHTVFGAANGVEALNILRHEDIDAVISDILMPTMDGFRLCREIRGSGQSFANVAFLFYTATYNSASDRRLASTVGADGYLVKPAPISLMLQSLRGAQRLNGKRTLKPQSLDIDAETEILEQYNAALVRKLERRNAQLQHTLSDLRSANEQIGDLNRFLEMRVEQRTAALAAANKELESFSHAVAHDLRAPLRHIAGYAQVLRSAYASQLDADANRCVDHIDTAVGRMDRMIGDILEMSRTARAELNVGDVNLEIVIDEALETIKTDTRSRDIRWKREALPHVRGDFGLLRQVFVNLLSNAVKFTRGRAPAVIEIGHRAGRAFEAVVFVRDNGVGFQMQNVGALFAPFERLHTTEEYEGTGVGLANAQRIIARHGGHIWAEGAVGHGATFFVSFAPASRPSVA